MRVADLLARMTRAEKLAQLGAIWAFQMVVDGAGRPTNGSPRSRRTGSARSPGSPVRPTCGRSTSPEPTTTSSATSSKDTRLGIPAVVHEECLHGLMAWDAPCFQQSIGAAATFDPAAVAAGRRDDPAADADDRRPARAWRPVLDIANDPRWGRLEETYGEDPYLAAAMGHAYTEALQGDVPGRRRRGHREAPHRSRPGRGRAQHGARPHRAAAAPRRAAVPVRGRRPPERHRQRHAGLLRRRRRPLPRLGRAADDDPARRVGLRRRRCLRLHRASRCWRRTTG